MSENGLDPGLVALDAALAASAPALSFDEQRLAVATYRLLASGHPVDVAAAAAAAFLPVGAAQRMLKSWSGIYRDPSDRVVGIWGLALDKMPHRLGVGGARAYAWCAWDPMFLALIVGNLEVSSKDPVTGEVISYALDSQGVTSNLSHPEPVLSFLKPDRSWGSDVIETFCHYVLLFATANSANEWTAKHPGTFVISFDEGLKLARLHARRLVGAALPEMTGHAPTNDPTVQ